MRPMPLPPNRGLPFRRSIFALAMAALLAGCANGDFQEVRPSLVRDDIHDWVGPAALAGSKSQPSSYELTDDERALRDLAYPLIEPPYDRHQWYSVAGEYGLLGYGRRGSFDRTAYWNRLMAARYRSPAARYARLADDIRNDTTRLPQFFETAARVLDMDAKRRKSLAYVSGLSADERDEGLAAHPRECRDRDAGAPHAGPARRRLSLCARAAGASRRRRRRRPRSTRRSII